MSQPLSEYLHNKSIRSNLPYRYNGETKTGYYIFSNGCLIEDYKIDEILPLGEKVLLWHSLHKGNNNNPDKTHVK